MGAFSEDLGEVRVWEPREGILKNPDFDFFILFYESDYKNRPCSILEFDSLLESPVAMPVSSQ